MTARRGFTLIEVIVALTISVALLSVVLGVMAGTLRDSRRARTHSEMLRDAEFVTHLLNTELRLAGVGVPGPTGDHINAAYGSAPPTRFYGAVLVARADAVGILADLPRPDANYSAFGALHTRPTGGGLAVAWHNENNGTCVPHTTPPASCIVGNDSLFFPQENLTGCTAIGGGAAFLDRTCPWGMRRTVAGEHLVIMAGNGAWGTGTLAGTVVANAVGGLPTVRSAALSAGYLVTVPQTDPDTGVITNVPVWPNAGATDGPGGIAGQGFVSTPDRVFYRRVGNSITRRQCMGHPDPNQAAFPDAATNAIPAAPELVAATGVLVNSCTDEDTLARNVVGLAFRYYNAAGGEVIIGDPVAGPPVKADVRRVDYVIDFRATVDGRDVTHRVQGSVRLANLP